MLCLVLGHDILPILVLWFKQPRHLSWTSEIRLVANLTWLGLQSFFFFFLFPFQLTQQNYDPPHICLYDWFFVYVRVARSAQEPHIVCDFMDHMIGHLSGSGGKKYQRRFMAKNHPDGRVLQPWVGGHRHRIVPDRRRPETCLLWWDSASRDIGPVSRLVLCAVISAGRDTLGGDDARINGDEDWAGAHRLFCLSLPSKYPSYLFPFFHYYF